MASLWRRWVVQSAGGIPNLWPNNLPRLLMVSIALSLQSPIDSTTSGMKETPTKWQASICISCYLPFLPNREGIALGRRSPCDCLLLKSGDDSDIQGSRLVPFPAWEVNIGGIQELVMALLSLVLRLQIGQPSKVHPLESCAGEYGRSPFPPHPT